MAHLRAGLLIDELASLRRLGGSLRAKHDSLNHHHEKLIRCGFASVYGGTLAITTMGRAKLVIEVTRVSWFPFPA